MGIPPNILWSKDSFDEIIFVKTQHLIELWEKALSCSEDSLSFTWSRPKFKADCGMLDKKFDFETAPAEGYDYCLKNIFAQYTTETGLNYKKVIFSISSFDQLLGKDVEIDCLAQTIGIRKPIGSIWCDGKYDETGQPTEDFLIAFKKITVPK